MIGKKISVDGFEGIVLDRYCTPMVPSDIACIKFKTGDNPCDWMWSELEDVTFLEEVAHEEETSPIHWEVGQEVFCLLRGRGFVVRVGGDEEEGSPYTVGVDFGYTFDNYTIDGKMFDDHKGRVLFFSEPVVTAELFPPKKPFIPKLKFDDKLMVINSHGKVECYGYVEQEFEDSVAMRTGEVYEKSYYNFFKLGEEVKFD